MKKGTFFNEINKNCSQKLNGSPLPSWVRKVYPEPMNTLSLKYLQSLTGTRNLRKLKTGRRRVFYRNNDLNVGNLLSTICS